MPRKGIVVIAGPSGVGKGTLIDRLKKEYPDLIAFCVSHTTRKPRDGEVNGVHYHFTTKEEMQKEIDQGRFLEHAVVHGNYYGTSFAAIETVQRSGKLCILDIDVQGVRLVRKAKIDATFIFIEPPSMEELENRIRKRGSEDDSSLFRRLESAKSEMASKDELGLFDEKIVNDNLEETYKRLKEIIKEELTLPVLMAV